MPLPAPFVLSSRVRKAVIQESAKRTRKWFLMPPTKSLLEWDDRYLIGVEELDYEHKDLFTRLNELHEELARYDNKAKVDSCLGEIYARVAAHFALEERFMRDTHFPNYEHHKKEHDEFLEILVDIIEAFRRRPGVGDRGLLEAELQRWIINHITRSDQELASKSA